MSPMVRALLRLATPASRCVCGRLINVYRETSCGDCGRPVYSRR
ncbi:hypothetical protein [Nocardiopsis suaedae]|uniref:Uncharacterized protein n=1 Tax=Nocardiopsis suaedae TaxID=3018444 RepID=A0ABT4TIC1_9ACTN|nr:hypothetical protein [Nocardiopsis suaedae]MDA2804459.1 hypothetical protein [Nocardiopsis suaedae]